MPSQANHAASRGTQLQNYRIVRLLAAGGFSFVYLAHDENDAPVAIKEYLPSTLALRVNGERHPQIPEDDLAMFRYGMQCFFEEGRRARPPRSTPTWCACSISSAPTTPSTS